MIKYTLLICGLCAGLLQSALAQETRTNNLIIFYDRTQTDADTLIAYAHRQGTTLLYRYNHLNAIAVHVPENSDYRQIRSRFASRKGVLQVSPEQILSLDSTMSK